MQGFEKRGKENGKCELKKLRAKWRKNGIRNDN